MKDISIDIGAVTEVLLRDGEWHKVSSDKEGSTFKISTYEFTNKRKNATPHQGGQDGTDVKGFSFVDPDGSQVSGPLTSVVAVRSTR